MKVVMTGKILVLSSKLAYEVTNEHIINMSSWIDLEMRLHKNKIIDKYVGQGYDNGTNMKGNHQGVQKRLFDVNPRAFYTPCVCHNLNLVLCDMNCTKVVSSFGVIQRIYTLFGFLPSGGKL
uniref:DUF4371 domain-containing protein n=1 Tax=Solanum lycopersicum TaxID=4081 RepID=K4BZ91_SOLLC